MRTSSSHVAKQAAKAITIDQYTAAELSDLFAKRSFLGAFSGNGKDNKDNGNSVPPQCGGFNSNGQDNGNDNGKNTP